MPQNGESYLYCSDLIQPLALSTITFCDDDDVGTGVS